ncbi:MAG: aminotransferase class V-fold PLP-dependent enzyme [Rhodoblastus sp.]|nr:MAG: aminotransferase class V-fold PLP-dependent enzyme [Rhodoblastus sp.]
MRTNVERHYADHNASAPLRPAALAAMTDALAATGNPSSVHAEGRAARARLEAARRAVASLVGAPGARVVWTSGASEAAATALTPALGCSKLILFAGEHPCVRSGGRFAADDVMIAPSDADGRIDLAALEEALARADGPAILALQGANNETGVIQPIAEAAALTKARGGATICDAAQTAGRIAFDLDVDGVDWAIVSSHKIGAAGRRALIGRTSFPADAALIRGGGQELGARAGTPNTPAIAGFGAAAAEALQARETEANRLCALRDRFEAALRDVAPDVVIFGGGAPRLPNTSCFAIPGLSAQTALIALDLAGVAASSGSACSSGKVGRSAMLAAMGVTEALAAGALRFSFGWSTSASEVATITGITGETLAKLLARRSRTAA